MPPNRLNKRWLKGLPPEAHAEFEERILQNADLFEALGAIIRQDLETNARKRRSEDGYEKPAFAAAMADCNGFERGLEKVLALLNFNERK